MKGRLISLDMFRGLTVALMILVNNPGSWSHIYTPLEHAEWNGWTPTDLVFPFFLFIVGVAMALSFSKRLEAGASRRDLINKILSRGVIIYGFGLFLNGFPFNIPLNAQMAENFHFLDIFRRFQTIRVYGVLQRIAFCYTLAGLTIVLLPRTRERVLAALGFFAIYELFMRVPLVAGFGGGDFSLQGNFVRYLDLILVGENHVWGGKGIPFDPEGLLSTFPAAVTVLSGYFMGEYLRKPRDHHQKLANLTVVGIILTMVGHLMTTFEPINKSIWTTSYVIAMDGMAILAWVFSSWLIDVKGWKSWAKPAIVFGSNPLVVFVGSGILGRLMYMLKTTSPEGEIIGIKTWLYTSTFVPLAGELNGSLLYALLNILFWLAILWWLYVKRIFVKI